MDALYVVLRYLQFRDNKGSHTAFYWHLLALKLGFVIIFEVGYYQSLTDNYNYSSSGASLIFYA